MVTGTYRTGLPRVGPLGATIRYSMFQLEIFLLLCKSLVFGDCGISGRRYDEASHMLPTLDQFSSVGLPSEEVVRE